MVYDDPNREIDQRGSAPSSLVALLDLDRCLLDTNALVAAFYATLEPDLALALRGEQVNIEVTGGSFDLVEVIRQRVGDDAWQSIRRRFLAASPGQAYLHEGAKKLMEQLRAWNVPFVIVTYGGEEWQRLKQKKAQLERIPMLVVDVKEKAVIISRWMNSDGLFDIPTIGSEASLMARRVVLVDDKADAFVGMPDRMYGIRVAFAGSGRPAAATEVPPPLVRTVNGFREVASYIDRLRQAG